MVHLIIFMAAVGARPMYHSIGQDRQMRERVKAMLVCMSGTSPMMIKIIGNTSNANERNPW